MSRVIVTVKRKDDGIERDLEVPLDVEAQRLAAMIAEALRWDRSSTGQTQRYQIEAIPLGRFLRPDECLGSAGVWDGSWLVLHRAAGPDPSGPPQKSPSEPVQVSTGFSVRFRPLGIDLPPDLDNEARPDDNKPGDGYKLKRLD